MINVNSPIYEEVKISIENRENFAIKKYDDICNMIAYEIQTSNSINISGMTAIEAYLIFFTVLYYRINRNLISINKLIKDTNPDSDDFEAIEFSVGILLRTNLLDCKLVYGADTMDHLKRNITDSFEHINKDFKRKQKHNLEVDQRMVPYFTRLIELLSNFESDDLKFDYRNDSHIQKNLSKYKNNCSHYYDIYSKYDHFSLYEIGPIRDEYPGRIKMLHESLMIQIPAINMCLMGLDINKRDEITDLINKMWSIKRELDIPNNPNL